MELLNRDNGQVLAGQVLQAYTFWKRLRGLMFSKSLDAGCCLHIRPCRSVHSFFMNYPIDVLHLDSDGRIVGMDTALAPGKVGAVFKGTISVVELPAGSIERTQTKIGQAVQFTKRSE